MKYALAVNRITSNIDLNIKLILKLIEEVKKNHTDFIIFPECSITGLINNDLPDHDLKLGISESSDILKCIFESARQNQIYVSIGFLELDNNSLYDSVICIDKLGNVISKYRRITDGWHGSNVDKEIYKEGTDIKIFSIENKIYSYLICGDLFDDRLICKLNDENIDILIFPFARTFYDGDVSQQKWEHEEMPHYIEQIIKCGAVTLMTNYINYSSNSESYFFGGAYVIDKSGKIMAKKEIGNEGLLYMDIP